MPMPGWVLVLIVSLACCWTCLEARHAPAVVTSDEATAGRILLQSANCTRIRNCQRCYSARNEESVTQLFCRACDAGYRPTSDGTACACAPGNFRDLDGDCYACPFGSFCSGGEAPATNCSSGLTTLTAGARIMDQCVTLPGFGYIKTRLDGVINITASLCRMGTFSPGRSTLPCRPCPGGLVTLTEGSTNVRSCLAPPGYLFDKMIAKACPRGTWKNTTDAATACRKCPIGLTTPAVAAISQDNCTLAAPGFHVVIPGVQGRGCSRGSYNPGNNNGTSCISCSTGLVTLAERARSEQSCLAPPGSGYDPAVSDPDQRVKPCPIGFYKNGFNRKACLPCGVGFLTEDLGSDTRFKCYIPAGWGTVRVSATQTQAIKCMGGVFGHPVETYGITSLPCRPCQAGMTTWDRNPGYTSDATSPEVINMTPSDCWTLPGYGYEVRGQAAKQCEPGTYNGGWNKEPCGPCGDGYTTVETGALNSSSCVVAPGWSWDESLGTVVPCDEGWYCPGLSYSAQPVPCPNGTTTVEARASSVAQCDVCLGGYGSWFDGSSNSSSSSNSSNSPSCSMCQADSFSPRGSTAPCQACPSGRVAAPGSDTDGDCWDQWQRLGKDSDFLPVSDTSILTYLAANVTPSDQVGCKAACDTTLGCVFYQFDYRAATPDRRCALYIPPVERVDAEANMRLAMKIDVDVYSLFPASTASWHIGRPLGEGEEYSVLGCARKCDEMEGCVAMVITAAYSAYYCSFRGGDLSQDLRTQYKVSGATINAWSF